MNDNPLLDSSLHISRPKVLGAVKAPARSTSQIVDQRPKIVSRQLSLNLQHEFPDSPAPKFSGKRQKLDATLYGLSGSSARDVPSFKEASAQRSPQNAFNRILQQASPGHDAPTAMQLQLPFPPRPNKTSSNNNRSSALDDKTKLKEVQAKPYALEASRSAPTYPDYGNFGPK